MGPQQAGLDLREIAEDPRRPLARAGQLARLREHLLHARVVGHAGQRARDAEQQARQVRFVERGGKSIRSPRWRAALSQ
jgi:hypothetical protein